MVIINGSNIETYILQGESDTGQVCINGAAGHFSHVDVNNQVFSISTEEYILL